MTDQRRREILDAMQLHNALSEYANLPQDERSDPEVAMRAVSFDGLALLYTPLEARLPRIVERAIRNSWAAAIYVNHRIVYRPNIRLVAKETAA